MRTSAKIYLNVFLLFFIAYFLGQFAYYLFSGNFDEFPSGIIYSLAFGILLSAILGTIQIASIKKVVSDNINFDRYKIKHSKVLTLKSYDEELIENMKIFLKKRRWKLLQETESETEKVFKYRSPMSLKSWGEIIYIRLFPAEEMIKLEITSIPILWTTLIDYGKNKKNVEFISNIIRNNYPENI